jgi:predicted transposase/invertase (TIGR01784 family)
MRVFTQDEMERDRYLARLEYQQMVKDIRKFDREEGLEEGLTKGSVERARAVARNLKRLGVDAGIIAEATGLAPDEVEGL